MNIEIRNYKEKDKNKIAEICLLTGYSGEDASKFFKHKELLAEFYALPYLEHEPEICFVATINDEAIGYIIGTKDSVAFGKWAEENWFPPLRKKYPLNTDYATDFEKRIIELIHEGYKPKPELLDYPAHLHIDILPLAQGQGVGKRLIQTFTNKLKELNVPALHLEVGKRNTNAVSFYKKVGFHIIHEYEFSIAFGMKLV